MADCPHLSQLKGLAAPKLSQAVHREECTQCFDDQDDPAGIDVCLHCFNGGCLGEERHHARTHADKHKHGFALNVQRKLKPSSKREEDSEPPAKITKLAIVEEREEDKYDIVTSFKCYQCDPVNGAKVKAESELSNSVLQSMSSARQSEVKAWEEEILACEHTLTLQQQQTGHIPASGLAHCGKCDLKENLWLCMTCGALGCGRQQFGGVSGNGHALRHYEETGHGVAVKLGTITPEGNADVYCYSCDDSKLDPEMAFHLSTFGINIHTQLKTEKTMTEINIYENLNYDFSLTGEDGKALEPVFGAGLTGLSNLGNSCYMASTLQAIFALPSFQKRYLQNFLHTQGCSEPLPAECLECQMHKIADGLLSGRYSRPAASLSAFTSSDGAPGFTLAFSTETKASGELKSGSDDVKVLPPDKLAHDSPSPVFQQGIKPNGFKALVGKGHAEFATMKQQDSEEFLTWLVDVMRRDWKRRNGPGAVITSDEPSEVFAFGLEQRLQCGECKKVRYRTDAADVVSVAVPAQEKPSTAAPPAEGEKEAKKEYEEVELVKCIDALTGTEALEYSCPECKKNVVAIKTTKFATFPEVMVVQAKKFQLVGWVPTKLDIPLLLPANDELSMDEYIGKGLRPNESLLPDESAAALGLPEFNAVAMAMLEGMGFPTIRCQKALLATGNSDVDAATNWLFEHMEDPDIDAPIQVGSGGGGGAPEPSPEMISSLADMGFSHNQARKALRETSGNAERAVEWLFNHPDDMGEDPSAPAPSSAPSPSTKVGGTSTLPAKYKLKAFISHKGPSVHSGHYVAHIRTEGDTWILFNDEKVVKADSESVKELKKLAYLYIFERA